MSSREGSKSKTERFVAAIGPLDEKAFKRLIRRGWIDKNTMVHPESSEKWVKAGTVLDLAEYFGVKSIADSLKELFLEIENLFSPSSDLEFQIPEQLFQTLSDELDKGKGEVAVSVGKVHGKPVFLVISVPTDGEPEIISEIEVDTTGWAKESIQSWPETGSEQAKTWMISR